MQAPKQKQSHSRTAKRRSQHKIVAPTLNACPRCHSPRRPHRVCAVLAPADHEHDHEHDH
jgi:large subunit ribosomal protein L32